LSALDNVDIGSEASHPDGGSHASSTAPAHAEETNNPANLSASDGESNAGDSRPALSARSGREPNMEAAPPTRQLTLQESFIALIEGPAQATQFETGVPASVSMAQAMLESDWGRSRLSRDAKNFFGIKATNKVGTAGVVYMDTWEVLNGKNVTVKAPFRAYNDMVESFVDHALYFVENSRYATAMKNIADARQFARLIHKAGYATDPSYSDKLISLMDKYNLYAYDLVPK
jgi:flagellum-specific peptidoglycan hydrolase FlgJ